MIALSLYKYIHFYPGCVFLITIQPLDGFLEIVLAAGIDIGELLRIAVYQRKPRMLNLDHDAVPLISSVSVSVL